MSQPPFRIVFPLYAGVTHLDFTGPHQVLSRLPGAAITVASVEGGETTSDGLTFSGLKRLADIEACEMICVPGGPGTAEAMNDQAYMDQIRRLAAGAAYITSVCTGSLILGAAGLLKGRRATCHWSLHDQLALFGAIPDKARVVRDGNVFTGGGVTAGIDFALTVAAEVAGPLTAQAIQLSIEYAPEPPFNAGRPELAPPEVLAMVVQRTSKGLPERRAAAERAAAAMA